MKLIKKILFFIFLLTSLLSPAKSHNDKMLKKVFPTLASTMKIQYSNVVSEGKKVPVNSGSLQITGYSNINFIAEEGVCFVSNDQFLDVVAFTYYKNIEVNNVMALHNVKETYCHAPVFNISNCTYLTFDYYIADGSGRYGFHITTNSESIKIVNTTITNCSTSAIYARNSSILMDNVLITKNTLSSSIFDLDNVKISMKNSAIKENTINYQEYFQVQNSSLKMTNVFMDIRLSPNNFHGVLFHNNTTAEVILKNSTIKIENGINLYSVVPLTLIDTKISIN
ncbi:hypothetical protein Celal_0121 [Cellulophaga algicola DSM 14237]|uniref:Right handed beta helix domain-containing protein n=1 Tax=Cellulophaga algicola (strain DSM 14237 / IC166 / ACAM 630) TaxID=688270 RepID=E6X729_CELAD|nr:hypothetical protein [Cellulophaga algicola]ADV47478.1 hypothetical protein Celal_0121 [Cellulophaga algicola DSM 14237]